jgi:SOS response regulatory protein OraA/RecX
LDVAFVDDLKRKLKEMGYSERIVEEILKWYMQNNS